MSIPVVLDATPLGILCHPRSPPHVAACRQWVDDLLAARRRVIIPEIADYEVRRELIRHNSRIGLNSLDQLGLRLGTNFRSLRRLRKFVPQPQGPGLKPAARGNRPHQA